MTLILTLNLQVSLYLFFSIKLCFKSKHILNAIHLKATEAVNKNGHQDVLGDMINAHLHIVRCSMVLVGFHFFKPHSVRIYHHYFMKKNSKCGFTLSWLGSPGK